MARPLAPVRPPLEPWALFSLFWMLTAFGCAPKAPAATALAPGKQSLKPNQDRLLEVEPTHEPAPYFVRDGKPFCFVGVNNYYLMYQSQNAVRAVLDSAVEMGATVVRSWAFLDRGSLDGRVQNVHEQGHKNGVYFQFWDSATARPAYNDGPNGLERLDFVLHEARQRGLLLILPLTNNWRDFGGMDQYLTWYGLDAHQQFYTDDRVKQAYKAWASHLIERVNSIDGVPYKDDPAVFAWELANEPRFTNAGALTTAHVPDPMIITAWAHEMSAHIKSLDAQHMVSVGDEGFFVAQGDHPAYQGAYGVDHEQLMALPHIDFGTYHLYPDHWGTTTSWGNQWVSDHIALGRRIDKPTVLEEYGLRVTRAQGTPGKVLAGGERREVAYRNWNQLILQQGGAGSLVWMLAGLERAGHLYPDYDGFTVHAGDSTFGLLQGVARAARGARACELAGALADEPASPFVQARPAPTRALPASRLKYWNHARK